MGVVYGCVERLIHWLWTFTLPFAFCLLLLFIDHQARSASSRTDPHSVHSGGTRLILKLILVFDDFPVWLTISQAIVLTYQMYYRMVSAYGARRAITRIDHGIDHCIDNIPFKLTSVSKRNASISFDTWGHCSRSFAIVRGCWIDHIICCMTFYRKNTVEKVVFF